MNLLDFCRRTDHLSDFGSFAESADDLIVITVSNENQRIPLLGKLDRLYMDLRHERTGGVNYLELPRFAGLAYFRSYSVCAVDDSCSLRNILDTIDKNCTFRS